MRIIFCGKRVADEKKDQTTKRKTKTVALILVLLCIIATLIITVSYVRFKSYTLEMDFTAKNFMHFIDGINQYSDELEVSITGVESFSQNSARVTAEAYYKNIEPVKVDFDFSYNSKESINPGYSLSISATEKNIQFDKYGYQDKPKVILKVCQATENMLTGSSFIDVDFNQRFGSVAGSDTLDSNYNLNSKYKVKCTYKDTHRHGDPFNYTITTRIIP